MKTRQLRCKICGNPTNMEGTKRCNNCWEVERRLEIYLQSEKGQVLVAKQLAKFGWVCKFGWVYIFGGKSA